MHAVHVPQSAYAMPTAFYYPPPLYEGYHYAQPQAHSDPRYAQPQAHSDPR